VLLAVGAAVLYQVAKRNGINSFTDLKNTIRNFVDQLNLKEWVNVDKLKELVAPAKEALATA
jgi:hypothetical protein